MPATASPASSTASSTAIDLSRLPAPDVVESLDYEAILARLTADFLARFPAFDALLESEPVIKLLEVAAYQELQLRQRVNDASRGVMVAFARGADLDQLGAIFGVTRLELEPADEQAGTPAIMEGDAALRARILLAPDAYSVAGPRAAYVFHALSASGDVADASATSPSPGEVVVSVLAREAVGAGSGAAPQALLDQVEAAVGAETVRPLTDLVTVQSAQIVEFTVEAQLDIYTGPDQSLIYSSALAALDDLLTTRRRIGLDVTRSAIFAALHVAGVDNVTLAQPAADVIVDDTQAAYAADISITVAGGA